MFNLKQKLISFIFVALPFLAFAETTKLQIWWSEREQIDMLRKIDSELSDIDIEIKILSISELNNEFIKASASGQSVPDIINVDNPFNAWLADNDLLLALDDHIAQSNIIDMDNFFDGPKSTVTWNNKIYGLPNSTNTIVLFYNKDAFKEAGLGEDDVPKTWDDFYNVAKKLTDPSKDRYGLFFSAVATEEGTFQILPWIQMAGANWDNINQEGTIEALNYLKRFLDEGITSKDALIKTQDPAPFVAGQTAMMITGPWALKDIRASNINWATTTLPVNPKYNIHASALGGMNVAIPKKSKNADAAFRFIEAINQKQDKLWNEVGFLTARTDVITENPKEEDAYNTFVAQLKGAKARGPHPEWPKISKVIYQMLQDTLIGKVKPEKAVERAQKSINKIMK